MGESLLKDSLHNEYLTASFIEIQEKVFVRR